MNSLIGNNSNVTKLKEFLQQWTRYMNQPSSNKPPFKRAALLSGPPGIGKSTTATLISELSGFNVVEFNASDVRNKAALEMKISEMKNNTSMSQYFTKAKKGGGAEKKKRSLLVMDEVDGMSGNSDRGGIQILVSIIKETKIPIICMCNDGNHPKIRTLKNYCLSLGWRRPTAQQISGRMVQIAAKEGLQIDRQSVEKISELVRADIRQVLNMLQFWAKTDKKISFEDVVDKMKNAKKDFDLGPFEVFPDFFKVPAKEKWMNDRVNTYFVDADILPLFVQENYLSSRPAPNRYPQQPKSERDASAYAMEAYAEAADFMSDGDCLSSQMRRSMNFGLMPLHGVMSCVAPGATVATHGRVGGGMFPQWMGKRSTKNKNYRILSELSTIMSVNVTMNSRELALYQLPLLRAHMILPLLQRGVDGVDEVGQLLNELALTKDDWDLITEMGSTFSPGLKVKDVPSKVKAALTRWTKKEETALKVTRKGTDKKAVTRMKAGSMQFGGEEDDDEVDGDGIGNDKTIQEIKPKGKGKGKASTKAKPRAKKKKTSKKKSSSGL